MRTLKTGLTVVILALLIAAALIATNWQRLLSPQQKLRYGLVFAATEDYARNARSNPADPEALRDYVDVLVRKGNLGRAYYLARLYGVEHEGLSALRAAIEKGIAAAARNEAYALSDDPAAQPFAEDPLLQALRFAEGYQHALLGDWMTAKNHFNAVDVKLLAPELKLTHKYYLGRSYRLAGDEEEKAQVETLLKEVEGSGDAALAARAAYNLVAWYLAQPDADKDWPRKYAAATARLKDGESVWAEQKIAEEVGRHALDDGHADRAWAEAAKALALGTAESSGKAVCQLALDALGALLAAPDGMAQVVDGYHPQSLRELAEAVGKYDFDNQISATLTALRAAGASPGGEPAKSAAFAEEAVLADLIAACRRGDMAGAEARIDGERFAKLAPAQRAAGTFRYAVLLEQRERWNDALRQYQRVIDLEGADTAAAHLARYGIVKRVQEPFDIPAAIAELRLITSDHATSEEYAKAVEELIPLLIFAGERGAATTLAQQARKWGGGPGVAQRTVDQLADVGLYWQAYIAEQEHGAGVAESFRDDMLVRYWNYYELTTSYPPRVELAATAELLGQGESAAEYLAGLGLTAAAVEALDQETADKSQLLKFFALCDGALVKSPGSRQWDATELLESGTIREQALLDYALNEAYPLHYSAEIAAAAAEFNVEPALICAVIKKETNFNPDSVSWAGAKGLMQLLPETASWLNGRYNLGLSPARIMEPQANIRFGAAYLRSLADDLGQANYRAIVHAYNGGPGNFERWRARYPVDMVLFTDVVPNEENEIYAKKVVKYFKVYDWLLTRSGETAAP